MNLTGEELWEVTKAAHTFKTSDTFLEAIRDIIMSFPVILVPEFERVLGSDWADKSLSIQALHLANKVVLKALQDHGYFTDWIMTKYVKELEKWSEDPSALDQWLKDVNVTADDYFNYLLDNACESIYDKWSSGKLTIGEVYREDPFAFFLHIGNLGKVTHLK